MTTDKLLTLSNHLIDFSVHKEELEAEAEQDFYSEEDEEETEIISIQEFNLPSESYEDEALSEAEPIFQQTEEMIALFARIKAAQNLLTTLKSTTKAAPAPITPTWKQTHTVSLWTRATCQTCGDSTYIHEGFFIRQINRYSKAVELFKGRAPELPLLNKWIARTVTQCINCSFPFDDCSELNETISDKR